MKIVFTVDALINAGTEKSIYEMAVILKQKEDVQIHVVYFFPFHDLKTAFEQLGVTVHFLDIKGKYNFIQGYFKLKKALRIITPDVVVSSLYRANIISRLVCKNVQVPLVGTFVSNKYSKFLDTAKKKSFLEQMFFKLDRYTAQIPQRYISNSDSIAVMNSIALSVPKEKITTIHRGRNSEHIDQWIMPQKEVPFHFISVGRLLYEKGSKELLLAFSKLKKEYPTIRLTFYGEGNYRIPLTELISEYKLESNVFLAGNVPFVYQQFSKANCFVFPSHNEGFSGALVEAMMSGIPIIASDIPMNLEALKEAYTGKVFNVKEVESLYSKMKWMLENYDQAIEYGVNARIVALDKFEIVAVANRYLQVLKQVAEK